MRTPLRSTLVVAVLSGSLACGGKPDPQHEGSTARMNAVDFAQRELVITRLGVPVSVPVSVGSRPSPATMRSSDPETVKVLDDGSVLGLRAGTAELQALVGAGPGMAVLVKPAAGLVLHPAGLTLTSGQEGNLRALAAEDSSELPSDAVEWATDAPDAVLVRGGHVKAWRPGTFRVRARYADSEAIATVVVAVGEGAGKLSPARSRLRVGEVTFLQAAGTTGGPRPRWESKAPRIVASMGDGIIQAVRLGRTKVCAITTGAEACADVEVVP